MNINGSNIVLRAIEESDCQMLLDLINDEATEQMLGGVSFPVSSSSQNKWFSSLENTNRILRCIIAKKDDPKIGIGTVILSDIDYINGNAQIHIKLSNNAVRKCGFGTDAIQTITAYAFTTLRLHCVYAEIIEYNEPSKKLFEKCGYIFDGVLKSRIFKKGNYWDVYVYSIQSKKN